MTHSNIPIRNNDAKQYRIIRKILKGNEPIQEPDELQEDLKHVFSAGVVGICLLLAGVMLMGSCQTAHADEIKASWYSLESLKKEGTFKYSHGRMSNGKEFKDEGKTCATRLYPLGTILRIINTKNNMWVRVECTDKIGKRFAKKRIDLSKSAFQEIAPLKEGLINVKIERI